MMQEPVTGKKKNFIRRGVRMQVLGWISIVGVFLLFSVSFAWYSVIKREADSQSTDVMEPYYLTLLNPSETDVLQLSVGSLLPGRTRQIVFCVSNKENEEKINMGGKEFDYSMELIYTGNLAVNFRIYELEKSDAENGSIVTEDTVTADGGDATQILYWKVKTPNTPLTGEDVSDARHAEVGLSGTEINRGTYIQYTSNESVDFHLSSGDDGTGYESQYFLMEMEWDDAAYGSFEKYEKETDMIYILVKALQPEPRKDSTQ